jgi:subtilase family serine protease
LKISHLLQKKIVGAFLFFLSSSFIFTGLSLEATIDRLPDLYVYVIGIEPRNPCVNDAITFTVEVKNSGTATAAASKLRLGIGGGPPVILSVPPIDPGKYENVSTTKSLSIAQQYIATAMVDYDNKVVESNEGNNEKSRDFKVIGPCCADLRPYLMWVDPPHPTTQNIFSINVWIRNIGNKTSSPTMLEVTVGGSTKPYVFSVPAISSKDQRMFKQDIIFDRPGQYRAQFNVDPQNNVAECNKQNNIGILNFEVK